MCISWQANDSVVTLIVKNQKRVLVLLQNSDTIIFLISSYFKCENNCNLAERQMFKRELLLDKGSYIKYKHITFTFHRHIIMCLSVSSRSQSQLPFAVIS